MHFLYFQTLLSNKEREGAVVFLLIYETEFLYRQTNFSPIDMNILHVLTSL